MIGLFWRMVARIVAKPAVVEWLIRRAKRTPYTHITGPDGTIYMERYWLFNAYESHAEGARKWFEFPIAVRLHRIMREDFDRDAPHSHPWNARTIILRGWYFEQRRIAVDIYRKIPRCEGTTATLNFGEYHRITSVSPGGVWTMFITGRKRGTWGFLVDGVKVPWRQYLGLEDQA